MDIQYKRCTSEFVSGVKYPIYAGADGSVVIFNTTRSVWEQLNQSPDKTNDYWVVSVLKAIQDNDKPRTERDVHRLICETWKADTKPSTVIRVDHRNGNRNDNQHTNLDWIDALGNAQKAICNTTPVGSKYREIIIDYQKIDNGESMTQAIAVKMLDGTRITAHELLGIGKGRPLTRVNSIIKALHEHGSFKGDEKIGYEIPTGTITFGDKRTVPDTLTVKRHVRT